VCGRRGRPVRHGAQYGARVYECKDLLLHTLQRLCAPASRRHARWCSPSWRNNKGTISKPVEGNSKVKNGHTGGIPSPKADTKSRTIDTCTTKKIRDEQQTERKERGDKRLVTASLRIRWHTLDRPGRVPLTDGQAERLCHLAQRPGLGA